MTAFDRAVAAFEAIHGHRPRFVCRAPGRVNLIGEHTDYNDGFVLPMALPFDTAIAVEPVSEAMVDVASEGFGRTRFDFGPDTTTTAVWARYLHGMQVLLDDEQQAHRGWRGTIATDIPAGASLSSSAALEVAAGLAFTHAAGTTIDPTTVARLGQRVENEIMGLPSGIMDQLTSAASVAGAASLIDCRELSLAPAPLPSAATVVVMDTGTRRALVDSAYADRQATCARVATALGVAALRDLDLSDLDRLDPPDEIGRRRATHVITENARTLAAAAAMTADDAPELGRLMTASHVSLRDDYEVSGPALDAVVELARGTPGCLGARMTGGGFAGGAVALVTNEAVADFCELVAATYRAPATQPAEAEPALYAVTPAAGASVIDL